MTNPISYRRQHANGRSAKIEGNDGGGNVSDDSPGPVRAVARTWEEDRESAERAADAIAHPGCTGECGPWLATA